MRARHLLLGVLWIGLVACERTPVPGLLVDVWRTDAPGYEDRFLAVRPDSIVFGTGGNASTGHLLTHVEVEERAEGDLLCILHYEDREGGTARLRVVLRPGPPATLRFENREEIWRRERDAAWLAKGEHP